LSIKKRLKLNLFIAYSLVIKTNNGKYYLDKEKLAQAKAQSGSKI